MVIAAQPAAVESLPETVSPQEIRLSVGQVIMAGLLTWGLFTVGSSLLLCVGGAIVGLAMYLPLGTDLGAGDGWSGVFQAATTAVGWFMYFFFVLVVSIGIGSSVIAMISTAIAGLLSRALRTVAQPALHRLVYFGLGFLVANLVCVGVFTSTAVGYSEPGYQGLPAFREFGATAVSWLVTGVLVGTTAGLSAAAGWSIARRLSQQSVARRATSFDAGRSVAGRVP